MAKATPVRQNTLSRQKILETAKTLFYEQGYKATTFAQISEVSGINNGLITYYFASKMNLASEVYTQYIIDMRNAIAKRLFEMDKNYRLEVATGIEQRLMIRNKTSKDKYSRFLYEYSKERATHDSAVNSKRAHYYQTQRHLINPNISKYDIDIYEQCGWQMVTLIASSFIEGKLDCDEEYMEDYVLNLIYNMLQLPVYQIENLLTETRQIADTINIRIGKDFKVICD